MTTLKLTDVDFIDNSHFYRFIYYYLSLSLPFFPFLLCWHTPLPSLLAAVTTGCLAGYTYVCQAAVPATSRVLASPAWFLPLNLLAAVLLSTFDLSFYLSNHSCVASVYFCFFTHPLHLFFFRWPLDTWSAMRHCQFGGLLEIHRKSSTIPESLVVTEVVSEVKWWKTLILDVPSKTRQVDSANVLRHGTHSSMSIFISLSFTKIRAA